VTATVGFILYIKKEGTKHWAKALIEYFPLPHFGENIFPKLILRPWGKAMANYP
jgi:hypothetical protein